MPGEADKLAASGAAADEFSEDPAGSAALDCPLRQNWIEIELVGPDGKGVANEPYEVRLADRSVLRGRLDAAGFRRVEHLPSGQHRVSFPCLQGDWVELELVGTDGNPMANEPFVVEDSDGKLHHGFLDGAGFARVMGVAPGECRVSFPERQEQHWLQIEAKLEDGTAASGRAWRVHTPDGKLIEGVLDAHGCAEVTGLTPGECTVEFPQVIIDWLAAP
jgi:hypothetical protein